MRKIIVSNMGIKEAYRSGGRKPGGVLYVNGHDEDTGELVRFAADAIVVAEFSVRADARDDPAAELTLDVGDADVISVTPAEPWATVEGTYPAPGLSELLDGAPEPVSGEWDSPGTSPEEYDDETF